jgi:hypothetical protein
MLFLPTKRAVVRYITGRTFGVRIDMFDQGGALPAGMNLIGDRPPLEPPILVMTRPQDWSPAMRRHLTGRYGLQDQRRTR